MVVTGAVHSAVLGAIWGKWINKAALVLKNSAASLHVSGLLAMHSFVIFMVLLGNEGQSGRVKMSAEQEIPGPLLHFQSQGR